MSGRVLMRVRANHVTGFTFKRIHNLISCLRYTYETESVYILLRAQLRGEEYQLFENQL